MCGITSGRTETCNNSIGGLKNIYLFDFVEYQRFLIETNLNTLVSYPTTTVFKYELRADGNTISSDFQEDEEGFSYNQNLSIVLKGLRADHVQINGLLDKRLGVITESRLGQFQIMGLINGVRVKNVKAQTGGAYSDFSGYNLDFEAREKNNPFYIDDLASAGFIVSDAVSLLSSSDLISSTSVLSSATFY